MAGVTFTGNLRSSPPWFKDFGNREHILPVPARVDPTQFTDQFGVQIATTGASATATSLPVTALAVSALANTVLVSVGNVLIPSGTVLYFGGAKVAVLTADAKVGDTSLTVAALPTTIASGDTAVYSKYGTKGVFAGQQVGRTYAERDAFTDYGPAATTDDEIFLVWSDRPDINANPNIELVRHGSLIAENFLPNYPALTAAANEVQTVAVDTILSGGKIGLTATDKNGVPQTVAVAYNTSWTQTVADIQTALNALLGTSAVAAAVTATHDMTLTFSGTSYANVAQPLVGVDISGATGPTKVTVTRTTAAGTAILSKLRTLYRCVVGAQ